MMDFILEAWVSGSIERAKVAFTYLSKTAPNGAKPSSVQP